MISNQSGSMLQLESAVQQESKNDLFVKIQTFKGHSDAISALVFDDSHGVLYTASLDNSIKVSAIFVGFLGMEFR